MVIDKINLQDCFGCSACVNICNKNALSFSLNEEGFNYPHCDNKKCIDCGLCDVVCPVINDNKVLNKNRKSYAAQSVDNKVLEQSSSGGVFSEICRLVFAKNGVVFGAAFDEHLILKHIKVDDFKKLNVLRGSKYIQSDLQHVFMSVKEELKCNKLVYFVGTPCQVAGLKLFLRKDYANLITSDLICHGVPSQKVLNCFIYEIEKNAHISVVDYKFRDKKRIGWSCTNSYKGQTQNERKVYRSTSLISKSFMDNFMAGIFFRESCYKCPFSRNERVGDITLADYWGVSNYHTGFRTNKGVSFIMCNTEKGEKIIHEISSQLLLQDTKIEWAAKLNHNLYRKSIRPDFRNESYKKLNEDASVFINSILSRKGYNMYILKFIVKTIMKKLNLM